MELFLHIALAIYIICIIGFTFNMFHTAANRENIFSDFLDELIMLGPEAKKVKFVMTHWNVKDKELYSMMQRAISFYKEIHRDN